MILKYNYESQFLAASGIETLGITNLTQAVSKGIAKHFSGIILDKYLNKIFFF